MPSSASTMFLHRIRSLTWTSPLVLLLLLLPATQCSSSPSSQSHTQPAGEKAVIELVRELRSLSRRVEAALGREYGDELDENAGTELIAAKKRSVGVGPSLLWNGGNEKRAQLPFSGGIYGKRSPLPFSGGIYGKRDGGGSPAIARLVNAMEEQRQIRAMPFNGGMYGR